VSRTCELVRLFVELWILPARWRRRLAAVPLPALLDDIEALAKRAPDLSLAPGTIAMMTHRRAVLTIRWRRTRCLLNGLLLLYALARTRRTVTLHFGCKMTQDDRLSGHCWLSSPDLPDADKYLPAQNMPEMFCRTLNPKPEATQTVVA
jgi:hypothetical protein